jgi:hypothetical protein
MNERTKSDWETATELAARVQAFMNAQVDELKITDAYLAVMALMVVISMQVSSDEEHAERREREVVKRFSKILRTLRANKSRWMDKMH